MTGAEAERLEATVALCPDGARSIVDVGAGDGAFLRALRERRPGIVVVVVDISAVAVAASGLPGVVGSVDALPFRTGSLDVVSACEVLEHLDQATFDGARRELGRVAGRWVLVTVPNREDRRKHDIVCRACGCRFNRYRHLRSFDDAALAELVPTLRVERVEEIGPRVLRYPWFVRAAVDRLGLLEPPHATVCPQCGSVLSEHGPSPTAARSGVSSAIGRIGQRLAPHSRRRKWLAAVFSRAA